MRAHVLQFNSLIDTIYNLSLEDKVEIKNLLEHNIADSRREEIVDNFKKSQDNYKSGKLKFSSDIDELKRMI